MSIDSFPRLEISWLRPQLPHEIIVVSSFGCKRTATIPQFGHVKTFGKVFLTTWTTLLLLRPIFYFFLASQLTKLDPNHN
jgi:hypothetical protein